MCSVQCAVCGVQCSAFGVQCLVYSVQCDVCSVQCSVCSVQCSVCSVQFTVYNVHCSVCTTSLMEQLSYFRSLLEWRGASGSVKPGIREDLEVPAMEKILESYPKQY